MKIENEEQLGIGDTRLPTGNSCVRWLKRSYAVYVGYGEVRIDRPPRRKALL